MFYFFSKAFDFLLMPLSLLFILLFYSLFKLRKSKSKRGILAAILLLYAFSNNFIVNSAFVGWEPPARNIRDIPKRYETGVLLTGGIIQVNRLDTDHPGAGDNADRLLQTYLLYRAGKIRKILISGTDHEKRLKRNLSDGQQSRALLIAWGVPKEDIYLESKARNTRENALFSANFLRDHSMSRDDILLITSAFHVKRSIGCFEKAGLKADAYPCDFYGGQFHFTFKRMFVPDGQTFGNFTLLWHELLGYAIYSLMGYC